MELRGGRGRKLQDLKMKLSKLSKASKWSDSAMQLSCFLPKQRLAPSATQPTASWPCVNALDIGVKECKECKVVGTAKPWDEVCSAQRSAVVCGLSVASFHQKEG